MVDTAINPLYVTTEPLEYGTLAALLGDYPDRDELLANEVRMHEWDTVLFAVIQINPVEWYNLVSAGGMSLRAAYEENAEPWQKRLVKSYRKKATTLQKEAILAINSSVPQLLDGHHRLTGLALEGISCVRAVDLARSK